MRGELEELALQSRDLERVPARWQIEDGPRPSEAETDEFAARYNVWFRAVAELLPESYRKRFIREYTGSMGIFGIQHFLGDPLKANYLFKWQYKYESSFRQRIERQRNLINEATVTAVLSGPAAPVLRAEFSESDEPGGTLARLARVFDRFDSFVRVLERSQREGIKVDIANEHDLQVLVKAVLRLEFDEVLPEEFVPSFGGSNSRVDFLLRAAGIFIECKMTRQGHRTREIRDELIVDIAQYASHPDCRALFCFVYDPMRLIENSVTLQTDLEKLSPSVQVSVQVNPRS